jgi:hypothetical protein
VWAVGLRIALLGAWCGSMLAFGAFAVPAAFAHLPTFLAAEVLGQGFAGLDRAGIAAGAVTALLGALAPRWQSDPARGVRICLPLAGTAAHAASHLWVSPALSALRKLAGGSVGALVPGSPEFARFQQLHGLSQALFGAATLAALVACAWDLGVLAGNFPRSREREKTP